MAQQLESRSADFVSRLLRPDAVRAPVGRESRAAELIVEPSSVDELAELVRACEAERIELAPIGAARTLSEIRSNPVALGVSLVRLNRVMSYEPDDMTVVAEAGLSVGELNRALAGSRQRLPVDPCDPDLTTLGALVAASHIGPLMLAEGTSRDLLIGVCYVGHSGKIVRGGGRVVKNVAGYDLMKVMGGSFGTLGIIVETTFKLRPMPENYQLAIAGYDRAEAAFQAAETMGDALPLHHSEVLSPALSSALDSGGRFLFAAGFGGNDRELDYLRAAISRALGGAVELRAGDDARAAYARLRDVHLAQSVLAARIATMPAELGAALIQCRAEFVAHTGSGIADVFLRGGDAVADAAAASATLARWRSIARAARGHLRVLAAAPALRSGISFFDDPNPGAFKLMRRMKAAFDPVGIFNPRCFVGGI